MSVKHALSPLALALMLPCAALVQAQEIQLNIPSQPLGSALQALGQQTNLQILFSPDTVGGKRSTAVNSRLEPQQALRQMLQGTGVRYSIDGSQVTLQGPSAGDALELGNIQIDGQALSATSEGTHSYAAQAVTIGKGTERLKDIPQSVTVVTRQRMDDQNMNNLQDAMRQVTGATIKTYNTGSSLNDVYMRGFLVDQVQVDGVSQITGQGDMATSFDLAMYDRVEVLRGPSGLYAGSGEPAGTINVVRKRALDTFALNGEVAAGSWDRYRTMVDVTGPLNAEGTIRGRAVTAYENNKSFVDYVENERPMFYGRLEMDLDPSTTLSFGGAYQKNDSTPAFGLPAYANGKLLDVGRHTYIDAKWNTLKEETWEAFTELDHALDNGGQWKTSLTYRDARTPTREFTWTTDGVDPATNTAIASMYSYYTRIKTMGLDSFVTSPFTFAGRTHEFTLGGEYQHLDKAFTYGTADLDGDGWADGFPIGIGGANDLPHLDMPHTNFNYSKSEQYGIYGRTKLSVTDELDVILGSRVTWFEADAKNANTFFNNFGNPSTETNAKAIPYGAIVYKLTPELSAYASYTSVFKPQSETDATGKQMVGPHKGKQYEVGLKQELLDGRLNASLAMFQIFDENRAQWNGVNGYEASGKVRSQGWETELTGNLTDNWSIATGYAFTMTKLLEDDTTNGVSKGSQFSTITPKHNFNLWTKYEFLDGALKGFHVAGGTRVVSETSYRRGDVDFVQGGYAVTTAQVGYKFSEHLSSTLTANNLFDRKYYDRVDSAWGSNFYGEPRNLTLTLRARY
ncbi:TonB-dependent siderophore receptor [Pseudomonas guariconensis]|uniref:TonB-dependent siderophore receptor n=1 Tax=Pseudomonas guariconensis TaxID=1288410 RepID=A0AAX0VX29_9PSED|nr:TonB-dependent siderophore receptor [Pseudomonas guariconensis]PLV23474.1 TonB-dependent siderophore receptor [Pseudomonas guariconensis]PLV28497.1 TonB-dependent siderophore receptor [Pseudomonas guariconensis]